MRYFSTRNNKIKADSRQAVLKGLSEEGGLFVPENIPLAHFEKEELLSLSYIDLCTKVLTLMLPDFGEDTVRDCVSSGYEGKFETEDCAQFKQFDDCAFLELYHGPTSAFKDMALCILLRLLTAASNQLGNKDTIHILTATSGDTGKAALEAFADVPGCRITVFYPQNGVSDIQKLQMQTQDGCNVKVCAVEGNFDDAQSGVKKAFGEIQETGTSLCSANSINIGRLVPQISYYFWAYAQSVKAGKITYGEPLNFAVPTGNFGDILAGWFAKKMGLPVGRLLCASNENNVLTDFIKTGIYDKKRDFLTTTSPSMDILISSNLERLLFYAYDCDDAAVNKLMTELAEKGEYKVSGKALEYIQNDFDAAFADSVQAAAAIKDVWESKNYLMDTHTAVAYACAKEVFGEDNFVVLSTASPYKFAPSVLKALGLDVPEDCFKAMAKLEEYTKIPRPPRLANLKEKKVIHSDVINPANLTDYVIGIIRQ